MKRFFLIMLTILTMFPLFSKSILNRDAVFADVSVGFSRLIYGVNYFDSHYSAVVRSTVAQSAWTGSIKVGEKISDELDVYLFYTTNTFSVKRANNKDKRLNSDLTGLGAKYYITTNKNDTFFINLGMGYSTFDSLFDSNTDNSTGVGYEIGIGHILNDKFSVSLNHFSTSNSLYNIEYTINTVTFVASYRICKQKATSQR